MKYGVILAGPRTSTKNIGDYIQSLAQIQFTGTNYLPIERERVSLFRPEHENEDNEQVKTIMNAWWMWDPDFWPPSSFIEPCMVSIHISPLAANKILDEKGLGYFRVHQPIGCRDTGTQELLQKKGIDSYFSACLSLTLGRKYGNSFGIREGIIFCDPYIPRITKKEMNKLLRMIPGIVSHLRCILKLSKNSFFKQYLGNGELAFEGKNKSRLRGIVNAISFVSTYTTKFDSNLLLSAEYISNLVDVRVSRDHDTLLKLAEERIKKYAKAKLVITSRIHCALPCIGLKTPNIFVLHHDMNDPGVKYNTPGRFGGLTDFFRILSISGNKFVSEDEILNSIGRIDSSTIIKNKSGWEQYEDALYRKCTEFMKSY